MSEGKERDTKRTTPSLGEVVRRETTVGRCECEVERNPKRTGRKFSEGETRRGARV